MEGTPQRNNKTVNKKGCVSYRAHIDRFCTCRCVPFFIADQPAEANALCGVIWARRGRRPNHRGLEGPVSFLKALRGVVVSLDGDRKGEPSALTIWPHPPQLFGKPRTGRLVCPYIVWRLSIRRGVDAALSIR